MDEKKEGRSPNESIWDLVDIKERGVMKLMDEMPGGFLIYHVGGKEEIIYANKALLRIFQCDSIDEFRTLTGNSFRGMVHKEDLESVEQSIRDQIASSQYNLDYVEYRIVRKDGAVRWVEDYGHFVKSETLGDIFYVFISDTTEKIVGQFMEKSSMLSEKKEKDNLIKSMMDEYDRERRRINKENLRRLEVIEGLSVNYESILYADLDEDTILPYRLSERTTLQFEGRMEPCGFRWYCANYVEVWVHEEDKKRVAEATDVAYIRGKLLGCKTYYVNYRVVNRGKIQYLQLRLVNVGNRPGVSQIVMGYRKVDEEIKSEMKQKQLLQEALSNANTAITAKNTFLSNMSHDIRTPLNAIFGYTNLAKKNVDDVKAVWDYLCKIEASNRKLLDLIEKVLEISWIEADHIQIEESFGSLQELVQEVGHSLLHLAEEKKIMFSVDCSELSHADVYCDFDKLRQVLFHLAENAVTYTEKGGKVSLFVRELERLPNDYAVYEFLVRDNGIGIGPDFLKHIFEPFEREKNTTFSGVYGMGLGLPIAKRITEKMGGKIKADSKIGHGSTFTVTLSLRIHREPHSTAAFDRKGVLKEISKRKILLAEDNEINQEIETELLRGLGFTVEAVPNGSLAVEKIRNSAHGEYALILMDIQMPVMDGREAAAAIRGLSDPVLARIPIIALSADAFEDDRRKSIESGMDEHLPKPIDVAQLLETMAKIVKDYESLYGE